MPNVSDIIKKAAIIAGILCAGVSHTGCSPNSGNNSSRRLLAKVGNARLHTSDLENAMPGGLCEADSIKFARAFIRKWIDENLVSEIAASEIDMAGIEQMVDEYRRQLVMWEYRRQMADSHTDMSIPEDSIEGYYTSHSQDFKLSSPIVKGIYLKVAEDSSDLPSLRKLYTSHKDEDMDRLEKLALSSALHFDYFRDTWINWTQVESRLPYEFADGGQSYLRKPMPLDFTDNGYTYLLSIDSVMPAESIMPYETARPLIVDRIINTRRMEYDNYLRKLLYDAADSRGEIEILCDMGS